LQAEGAALVGWEGGAFAEGGVGEKGVALGGWSACCGFVVLPDCQRGLTVREHGCGPDAALGRWLNLLSELDMVARWRLRVVRIGVRERDTGRRVFGVVAIRMIQ
jgi:hypothetical protein